MRTALLAALVCGLGVAGCQSADVGGEPAPAAARSSPLPVVTTEDARRAFEQNPTAVTAARIRRNQN